MKRCRYSHLAVSHPLRLECESDKKRGSVLQNAIRKYLSAGLRGSFHSKKTFLFIIILGNEKVKEAAGNLVWPQLSQESESYPILSPPFWNLLHPAFCPQQSYPNTPPHLHCQKPGKGHEFIILNMWWHLQTKALFFLKVIPIIKF